MAHDNEQSSQSNRFINTPYINSAVIPPPPRIFTRPTLVLAFVTVSIFLAEALVMIILHFFLHLPTYFEILLDSLSLIFMTLPLLYVFLLRPLEKYITDRKKYEELLAQTEHDWEDIFNSMTDMVTIHDNNFNIVRANKSAQKMLNLPSSEEFFHAKCFRYYHGTEAPPEGCPSCNCLKTKDACSFELFEPHLNKFVEIRAIPRINAADEIVGLIHVARDITKRKKMEKKLQELSLRDDLTGLYNRRGFFTLVNHHIKIAKRQNKKLFLLYADLDNLKEINDILGHQEGDLVLSEVADILNKTYRESDIIARIGGDEFVVFPAGSTKDNIESILRRLQGNLDIHNSQRDRIYNLSVSTGISTYDPESTLSVDELLAEADRLMYENKQTKKTEI